MTRVATATDAINFQVDNHMPNRLDIETRPGITTSEPVGLDVALKVV